MERRIATVIDTVELDATDQLGRSPQPTGALGDDGVVRLPEVQVGYGLADSVDVRVLRQHGEYPLIDPDG